MDNFIRDCEISQKDNEALTEALAKTEDLSYQEPWYKTNTVLISSGVGLAILSFFAGRASK